MTERQLGYVVGSASRGAQSVGAEVRQHTYVGPGRVDDYAEEWEPWAGFEIAFGSRARRKEEERWTSSGR